MSLGPIMPGRIPNSLIGDRLNANIQTQTRILTQLQEQLSSGQQFQIPGESPSAALRTITLQKSLERKSQMQVNIQTDSSLLAASESALTTISDALNRARTLVFAGIGDSSSSEEKQAMALEAGSLLQQAINVGNTKFRNRFLFGGSQTNAQGHLL